MFPSQPSNRVSRWGTGSVKLGLRIARSVRKDVLTGILLLLPAYGLIIVLIGYPMVFAVLLAFQDLYLVKGVDSATWIGLANFQRFLWDPRTPLYIKNTVIYVTGCVSTQFILGLLMATLLNRPLRFRSVLRAVALVPWVMPTLVSAIVWRWLLDGQWGILNWVLMKVGLISQPVIWLADRNVIWPTVIFVTLWRHFPFWYVNLLAGLQVIPQDLYEVATIDGASTFRSFLHITLPLLKPVIIVLVLLETIWHANEFATIWALTRGGPGDATMTLAPLVYMTSFSFYRMGYGSSIAVVLSVAMMVLTAIYLRRTSLE
jgi:multiple sugar transport system permease protein